MAHLSVLLAPSRKEGDIWNRKVLPGWPPPRVPLRKAHQPSAFWSVTPGGLQQHRLGTQQKCKLPAPMPDLRSWKPRGGGVQPSLCFIKPSRGSDAHTQVEAQCRRGTVDSQPTPPVIGKLSGGADTRPLEARSVQIALGGSRASDHPGASYSA